MAAHAMVSLRWIVADAGTARAVRLRGLTRTAAGMATFLMNMKKIGFQRPI
jgi:hypothetical protein